jgi:tRNA pseudouridine55 synthase
MRRACIGLRRTAVEPYDATRMVTLDALRERAEQGLGRAG